MAAKKKTAAQLDREVATLLQPERTITAYHGSNTQIRRFMGYDSIQLNDDWVIFDPARIKIVETLERSR